MFNYADEPIVNAVADLPARSVWLRRRAPRTAARIVLGGSPAW